jgi:hypothetical protein
MVLMSTRACLVSRSSSCTAVHAGHRVQIGRDPRCPACTAVQEEERETKHALVDMSTIQLKAEDLYEILRRGQAGVGSSSATGQTNRRDCTIRARGDAQRSCRAPAPSLGTPRSPRRRCLPPPLLALPPPKRPRLKPRRGLAPRQRLAKQTAEIARFGREGTHKGLVEAASLLLFSSSSLVARPDLARSVLDVLHAPLYRRRSARPSRENFEARASGGWLLVSDWPNKPPRLHDSGERGRARSVLDVLHAPLYRRRSARPSMPSST